MERPLTPAEQAIFARHRARRDQYAALAQEEENILNELAIVIGGDGCHIDLEQGLVIPADELGPEAVEDEEGVE